jgi:hypothetical protein
MALEWSWLGAFPNLLAKIFIFHRVCSSMRGRDIVLDLLVLGMQRLPLLFKFLVLRAAFPTT